MIHIYRLTKDENLIASGKACKTNVKVRTRSREQRDNHHWTNNVNRETKINCPSNTASTTASSILAAFLSPGLKSLDKNAKIELFWWIENLRLYNGKSLILPSTDLCISKDASTQGCVMGGVHSTSWKYILYFLYIFRTGWNFLIKFCSSDQVSIKTFWDPYI